MKRAIILDMDETLEHGVNKSTIIPKEEGYMMTLRPNLDKLIAKLNDVKAKGIDIILCTTGTNQWVDKFFELSPEFKNLLNKVYTRDNENEWNPRKENQKPVETFGYNSILFIDDNRAEKNRLEALYSNKKIDETHDITYFSGFYFGNQIDLYDLANWMELAKNDEETKEQIAELLTIVRNEPGCDIMCSVIDDFEKKDFVPGLTLADENYSSKYKSYKNKRDDLGEELEDFGFDHEDEIDSDTEEEIKNNLKKYMETDKKIPYEDIENYRENKNYVLEDIKDAIEINNIENKDR